MSFLLIPSCLIRRVGLYWFRGLFVKKDHQSQDGVVELVVVLESGHTFRGQIQNVIPINTSLVFANRAGKLLAPERNSFLHRAAKSLDMLRDLSRERFTVIFKLPVVEDKYRFVCPQLLFSLFFANHGRISLCVY